MIPVEKASTATRLPSQLPHRELVERVLASTAFAKSKRLSELLAYLCDLTLNGRASELNEQRVGEEVFGRPRDYDSMIDGIVRTQVSRLRQRLDLYFNDEGANESIRITIPRGSYAPLFEPNSESQPAAEPPIATPPAAFPEPPTQAAEPLATPSQNPWHSSAPAWTIATLSLLALLAVLFVPRLRTAHAKPIISAPPHPIWSKLFVPGQSTLLVPGDSSLVNWESLKNRNINLDEYISGAYRDFNPSTEPTPETITANLASRRYTSIVDLEIAAALGRIARDQAGTLDVRYPRELRPNDLKQSNAILVGSSEADPWITLFERDMDFSLYNDRARQTFSVFNRSPRSNEPRSWDVITTDPQHRVYAVVAWLPQLSGDGHVLLLEGVTMAGTECAWDFISDDSRLLPFLHSIQRPDGTLPYFEVMLGTNNVNGSAVESTILAYRVR